MTIHTKTIVFHGACIFDTAKNNIINTVYRFILLILNTYNISSVKWYRKLIDQLIKSVNQLINKPVKSEIYINCVCW